MIGGSGVVGEVESPKKSHFDPNEINPIIGRSLGGVPMKRISANIGSPSIL